MIIQYLDNLLFIGSNFQVVQQTTIRAAQVLGDAGYIFSPKSILTPVQSLSWMGKCLNPLGPTIAPSPSVVADLVARWLKFSLRPYHYKNLKCL